MKLTDTQVKVLAAILTRNAKNESPTYKELGEEVGLTREHVWGVVNTLTAKGIVEKGRGWRSIWAIKDDETRERIHGPSKKARRNKPPRPDPV